MNKENLLRALGEELANYCDVENVYPAKAAEEYLAKNPDISFSKQEILDAIVEVKTENDLED